MVIAVKDETNLRALSGVEVRSSVYSQFNKKRNILTLFCFPENRVSTPLNALRVF